MKTILLATDGSAYAGHATAEAIELAQATGWPLHVVTVWNIPVPVGYGLPTVVPEMIEGQREHAANVAEATVRQASEAGVATTSEVREGVPADEICDAARELPAGLVVVGAHGWGPVKRILIGSVSTHVLHDAPCPVLVVRGEDAAAEEPQRTTVTTAA